MAVSGSEWDLLKAIADVGGRARIKGAGANAGLSSDYARIVGYGLGKADYIDFLLSGRVEITPKGWQELRRKGWQPPERDDEEDGRAPAGPLDKLRALYETGQMTAEEYRAKKLEMWREEGLLSGAGSGDSREIRTSAQG